MCRQDGYAEATDVNMFGHAPGDNRLVASTEGGGDLVSPSSTARFVFSDGELTPIYGIVDAEDFGLAEDYRYCVDGTQRRPSTRRANLSLRGHHR